MEISLKNLTAEQIEDLKQQLKELDKQNQPITERVRTFKDVLTAEGITENEWLVSSPSLSTDEVAYRKLKLIAKVLNQGWEPNWDNGNELKYYPIFRMSSSAPGFSYCAFSYGASNAWCIGSRLVFKSRELAEHAGKYFIEEYKDFYML